MATFRTDNRGVAHAFARKNAATNSNGQFYTNGKVLYSYGAHWPLAAWIDGKLYVNDARYSVTTSKHRSFACAALASELMLKNATHIATTAEMRNLVEAR